MLVLIAQSCNPAIGGQGQSGYTRLVGQKSSSEQRISILIKQAQGCLHTFIAGFGKHPPLVCALGQTIPTSNDCVVRLGPIVWGPTLRCVNYCPQAGWYDSFTASKHASQATKFAAGSAQTGGDGGSTKMLRHWTCKRRGGKTIPPAEGHQHLLLLLSICIRPRGM